MLFAGVAAAWIRGTSDPVLIVGKVPLEALDVPEDVPSHIDPPVTAPEAESAGGGGRRAEGNTPKFTKPSETGVWPPNGRPPGPPKRYVDQVDDSGGLQFVLVLGSDARAGNPTHARSDSIHILAIDPKARRGTVLGIPRDSYVDIPGQGKRKINDALARGGPDLAVRTVRELTGMPIEFYLLTAFEGFRQIVDDLGGVDAHVPYDMNDGFSGALFQAGWHHMDGERALAFTRNRHVPSGDFARSHNQARLMLDVLKKLRAETSTQREVEGWARLLSRHVETNVGIGDLVRLGVLARVTAVSQVTNVVAPGRAGNAGKASVVYMTDQAYELFADVRQDAVVNGSYPSYGPPQEPEAEPGPEASPGGQPAPNIPLG